MTRRFRSSTATSGRASSSRVRVTDRADRAKDGVTELFEDPRDIHGDQKLILDHKHSKTAFPSG